tara:strand:- start:272 stop:790 length:519 start_codon:yes stop_codon:yes gene_type:complete
MVILIFFIFRDMKKTNLLYLLSILLFTSCTQTINYNENKEYFSRTKGIQYYKGSPFTGVEERYFNTGGQLSEKTTFKDGKYDGPWESYSIDGQLLEKGTFKDGELDGLYESYYNNGQLEEKSNWKDGEKDGLLERYYENGQLQEKSNWKDGTKDGLYEYYNNNGQLVRKETY